MKHYYIRYPRNFSNEYDLVWIEASDTESILAASEAGYERITRKSAYAKISDEKYRRKTDYSSSGYAPVIILPFHVNLPTLPEWDGWLEMSFERRDLDSGILHCCSHTYDRDINMYSADGIVFETVK